MEMYCFRQQIAVWYFAYPFMLVKERKNYRLAQLLFLKIRNIVYFVYQELDAVHKLVKLYFFDINNVVNGVWHRNFLKHLCDDIVDKANKKKESKLAHVTIRIIKLVKQKDRILHMNKVDKRQQFELKCLLFQSIKESYLGKARNHENPYDYSQLNNINVVTLQNVKWNLIHQKKKVYRQVLVIKQLVTVGLRCDESCE